MKTKNQSKPGTVGRSIEQLVKRFGSYPMGHYIVQRALETMSGVENAMVQVSGKCVHQTPGYKAAQLAENQSLGRMGIIFYKPELGVAKKYTPQGTVVAVRFAPGMSEQAMRESLERDAPTARDWRPYNEADNTFTDVAA